MTENEAIYLLIKIKEFIQRHTLLIIVPFVIALSLLLNYLSNDHIYNSGLFFVLILVILDILKSLKKEK